MKVSAGSILRTGRERGIAALLYLSLATFQLAAFVWLAAMLRALP